MLKQFLLLGLPFWGQAAATSPPAPDRLLELQVRLDRARFSPGEIDGVAGTNLRGAAEAFKRERMGGSDVSDEALIESLRTVDSAPVLIRYTVRREDLKGPFARIPKDLMAQAKLRSLGYESALEGLAERFHSNPALLQKLNRGSRFRPGDEIHVPNVERQEKSPEAAKVIVVAAEQAVLALDAQDAVIARYPATLGSEKDPLPVGEWKINGVSRDPRFHYNPALFWDANPKHSKATLAPGPNNPVGRVWIDLSRENLGIHGTPEPSMVGKRQSHGCIRLTNWDALDLADRVKPGTPALLLETRP